LFADSRCAITHAFSSGWVQNSGVGFLFALSALIIAMATSTQVKAAALTFACIGTAALWILTTVIIRNENTVAETEYAGLLLPDNRPTPDNPCHEIPNDAVAILLGRSAAYASVFPHTVLRIRGDDVLTMNRLGNQMAISAKVFSTDGRIIAEIRDNEFSINPNNYFRKERPNRHTLRVFDQQNRKVLDVDFINPRAIRFSGIFNYPNRPFVISETEGIGANTICFGNNRNDINLD